MAYEIETDVEMPVGRTRAAKYPYDDLAVGQSFFIPGRLKKIQLPKRLKLRKFEQAAMPRNGAGSPMGLRVKRVE